MLKANNYFKASKIVIFSYSKYFKNSYILKTCFYRIYGLEYII